MTNPKIVILQPSNRDLDNECAECMNTLLYKQNEFNVAAVFHHNCGLIDMARSMLADTALDQTDADVLFWIDDDMVFDYKDVLAMSKRLVASDFDVLGAACAQRKPGGLIAGGNVVGPANVEFFQPGLREIDKTIGFGFTAVKRAVFEKLRIVLKATYCPQMRQDLFPYFHHFTEPHYLAEDSSFCKRVRDNGMRLAIDCEPRVMHRGKYNYGLEDTVEIVRRVERLVVTPY